MTVAQLATDQDASQTETLGPVAASGNVEGELSPGTPPFVDSSRLRSEETTAFDRVVEAGRLERPDATGNEPFDAPVIPVPRKPRQLHGYQLLQQWEGVVTEVKRDRMVARLRDVMGAGPDKVASIDLEQVANPDRELVARGAVFYWTVGYKVEPHGQKKLESGIQFQRLPAWTRSELDRARRLASEFDDAFGGRK